MTCWGCPQGRAHPEHRSLREGPSTGHVLPPSREVPCSAVYTYWMSRICSAAVSIVLGSLLCRILDWNHLRQEKKTRREEEGTAVGRAMFLVEVVRLGSQEGNRFPRRVWIIICIQGHAWQDLASWPKMVPWNRAVSQWALPYQRGREPWGRTEWAGRNHSIICFFSFFFFLMTPTLWEYTWFSLLLGRYYFKGPPFEGMLSRK